MLYKSFVMIYLLSLISFASARPSINAYQHIAVIENEAYEQTLPAELRNPFYKTPRVRAALAKSSWFAAGERPVLERQAEKIPRIEIFNALAHAGLLKRLNYSTDY